MASELAFLEARFVPGTSGVVVSSVGEASCGHDDPDDWGEPLSLNVGCSSGVKVIFTRKNILERLNFFLCYHIIKKYKNI